MEKIDKKCSVQRELIIVCEIWQLLQHVMQLFYFVVTYWKS